MTIDSEGITSGTAKDRRRAGTISARSSRDVQPPSFSALTLPLTALLTEIDATCAVKIDSRSRLEEELHTLLLVLNCFELG